MRMRQAAAHLRNWAKTDIFTAFIVCNKDEKANLRMGPAVARFHAGLCPKQPVGRYGACACGGPVRGGNRRRPLFRGRPAEFRQEQPRRRRNVSFFAGAGVGYAFLDNSAPVVFDDTQSNWGGFSTGSRSGSLCFMPRIGVELFHHLRVTFDYKLQERANRHFGLSLGVVFGGGRR